MPFDWYKAGVEEAHRMGKPAFVRAYGPGIFPGQSREEIHDSGEIARRNFAAGGGERALHHQGFPLLRTAIASSQHDNAQPPLLQQARQLLAQLAFFVLPHASAAMPRAAAWTPVCR